MSIRNFIIFISLCVSPLLAQTNPLTNDIVVKIKTIANENNVPNEELEKAYVAMRSCYLYGKELEFAGTESFGELFDKQRFILEKLKYLSNVKLSDASYEVLKKYEGETIKFDAQTKAEFLDDIYHISEGLKAAME